MGQFKPGRLASAPYDILTSVALPFLTLESVSYRFGLHDKAQQTASLRGDSIYYNPGSGWMQEVAGTGATGQTIALANPAYPFNGDVLAGTRYALGVSLKSGKRLLYGVDYTETVTANGTTTDGSKTVSVVVTAAVATTDSVKVIYSSPTKAVYPQVSHTPDGLIKPAAIRGKDIQVYIGGRDVAHRFHGVQSVQADYKVTLQKDEEFGSIYFYAQDFDVPDVTGSIDFKARDPLDLYNRIAYLAGVATVTESVGALTFTDLPIDIVLHSPIDGHVLKTIYVPDATFTLPSYQGRVQQKLTTTFNFESQTGEMFVYAGARP
jgi:hypothetical protein